MPEDAMGKPAFSKSPTLLQVDDVEAAVRCLHEAFGLDIVGSCGAGEAGEDSCGMLEVVVLPKSADVLGETGTGGCATLTLATDSVRRTASAAVKAGARLVHSYRVHLHAEETTPSRQEPLADVDCVTEEASAGTGTTTTHPNPSDRKEPPDLEETGMALLEGLRPRLSGGKNEDNTKNSNIAVVRVLLVDERLLACRRRSPGAAESSAQAAAAAAAAAASAVASVETGLFGVAETEPSSEVDTSSLPGEQEAGRSAIAAQIEDGASDPMTTTTPGEGGSTPPPLLAGFASLVQRSARSRKGVSCSSGHEHGASSAMSSAAGLGGAQTRGSSHGTKKVGKPVEVSGSGGDAICNGHGPAANGSGGESESSSADGGGGGADQGGAASVSIGSWFSEEELLREREEDGHGDQCVPDDGGQSGSPPGAVAGIQEKTAVWSGSSAEAAAPAAGASREVGVGSSRQAAEVAAAAAHAATNGAGEVAKSNGDDKFSRSAGRIGASEEPTPAGTRQEAQPPGAVEVDEEQEQDREKVQQPQKQQHEEDGRVSKENGSGVATTEVEVEQKPGGASRARPRRRQRLFRQLEAFMLGNDAGALKASPNSIRPIPIDNQHFQGSALLMIKREPMDKSYAHMFEGKNRMFEVQVQGRFRKPPEGELYISLEITDMMKLGLLTKGLCKLLLSFGKKLNRRLHYSFGDKDNAELPHISFPLVTSVDSLVCTPDGGEVPVLGRPFEEDKQSKASRKNGVEDNAKGIGKFQTGFTYSFSFHSMYIDMAQWSTCKIPVMRDVDLHTFWGNSALRIAAYVIKPSSSAASAATASHLQSELEYVFCVQVRHLPQSELGDVSEEEDWDEDGELEEEEEGTQIAAATAAAAVAEATPRASKPVMASADREAKVVVDGEEEEEEQEEGDGFVMDGEGGAAGIGDVIVLPLLTDREPSPRGRQMSASRWASNDDASDGEMEKRRERRRRRRRAQSDGTGRHATAAAAASVGDDDKQAGVDSSVESDDDDDDDDDDDEYQEARCDLTEGSDSEQDTREAAAVPAPINEDTPRSAPGLRAAASQPPPAASSLAQPSPPVKPVRATTEGRQAPERGSVDGGVGARLVSASSSGGNPAGSRLASTWDGATRGGAAGTVAGGEDSSARRGQEVVNDAEEAMVRCPAYVDLYARSPKLQGTWTVFCVVKRGANGGEFALKSSKNLSILPANVVQANIQHSPRLSRKERKRRKVDTVLQVLTAPGRAEANRPYQVAVRAVLGMESSADRAYRSYNPAPTAISTVTGGGGGSRDDLLGNSSGSRHAAGSSLGSPPAASPPNEERQEQYYSTSSEINFSAGISVEDATLYPPASGEGGSKERTPPFSPPPSSTRSGGSSSFGEGFSASGSANTAGKRKGSGGGSGGGGGSGTGRRRSWVARSASSPVKEGMVLRVLSEHHLSQQVAVLLPSSLTFSRPRKQCLRLSTRDIIHVELAGGGFKEGSRSTAPSPSSQLIPGMYLVEIHTIGRVHYMLVEGLPEARAWAVAVHAAVGHDTAAAAGSGSGGRSSPSASSPSSPSPQISGNNSGSNDDLSCISDPFSQYLTKKSSWKASNFWVLNCRRVLDLNCSTATAGPSSGGGTGEAGWGGGCWMDQGGLGEEVCDFVTGLLNQALELNDDSKPEQLITFLDDICRLRWMPLEGLSHNEQLSVFLNLYHVMLLHAFFILGPPGSPLRVASYFTTLCYEVGGDVLSLADLEHGVLRAKTSQPKQFLSKLIIPTTEYPFSLRQPEPRVSFALNCGSASGVPGVIVYKPDVVQEQLEDASTYYVQSTTEVLVGKRTVILPRIVYWYSADFSNSNSAEEPSGAQGLSSSSSSPLSCLLHVKRYLTGEKRRQVEALLSDGGNVTVKFGNWNWKCRPVNLVADSELETLRSGRPSPP